MTTPLRPRGVLIAIEGIDGAGKTTQAAFLATQLEQLGLEVVRTKEPTDGPWGRMLRAAASVKRLEPPEELHAFLEDRRQHVDEMLKPALARGAAVIVDRYYFSTVAYQGARGMDVRELLRVNEAFAPEPDLLVLLDVPADVGVRRITGRDGKGNLFEREEDLAQSAAIFGALDKPYLVRLDGTRSIANLRMEILRATYRLPAIQRLARLTHPATDDKGADGEAERSARIVEDIAYDDSIPDNEKASRLAAILTRRDPT